MKKKYMTILLAAAMLSLTACGAKDSEETDHTQTSGEQDAEVEESSEDAEEETYTQVSYESLTSTLKNLGEYKGIQVTRTVETVTDEDVADEIRAIKKEYGELVEADRPAERGDVILIDYTGYVDGETSDSLQGTEFSLELGSGTFIPGFEDQLIGVSADEDCQLNLTFPEDYYEDMAGKDVTFDVHVQSVSFYEVEGWGDDFIKENLNYDSEEAMAASIREELEAEAESDADANLEYDLIVELINSSEFEIQEADVEACTEEMLTEYKTYASMYGVELEVFLQNYVGVTEQQLREAYRETADFRVKMMLALHEVAAREGIEVSDEECEEKLSELAEQYGYESAADVEAVYSKDMVRSQMLQERAINLIRENAEVL